LHDALALMDSPEVKSLNLMSPSLLAEEGVSKALLTTTSLTALPQTWGGFDTGNELTMSLTLAMGSPFPRWRGKVRARPGSRIEYGAGFDPGMGAVAIRHKL